MLRTEHVQQAVEQDTKLLIVLKYVIQASMDQRVLNSVEIA
jgi:hypothetical protein